jgi:glycosyltransferase involved in cell wall biosynthesis
MSRKPRVLMVSESSHLASGFSVYAHECLKRLHATGEFELFELGSFGSPNATEILDIPWTFRSSMPNPGEEEEFASSPLNRFGAWRFEQACLDFRPDIVWDYRDWWYCLTAGTSIVCDGFTKSVQDVVVGDRVLTHKGHYWPVTYVFPAREHDGLFVTIKASHSSEPVVLTENHPVLVVRAKGPSLPDFSDVSPEWVNSQDVKEKDYVCFPVDVGDRQEICPSMAKLLGYYAAEGCLMYEGRKADGHLKGVQWTLHGDEWEYANEISQLVESLFGVRATINKVATTNTLVVRVCSYSVAKKCRDEVGELAGGKNLSHNLYFTKNESTRAFLSALFKGDGHLRWKSNTRQWRGVYTTKSKALADQVFRLCLRHGVMPSYAPQKTTCKGKQFSRYVFSFAGEAGYGFAKLWNNLEIPAEQRCRRIRQGLAFMTVRKVEHERRKEPVYNFEVAEDNSYVSSFALHNCEFEGRSPFRKCFHWALMPTVDAEPQEEQWLASYLDADAIFTYTDWGMEQLRKQTNGRIKGVCAAPPGADTEVFRPFDGMRQASRQVAGIAPDSLVVGTCMRNQTRKLYPDLIEAFAKFLATAPDDVRDRTYLYLHTCYPESCPHWDIPRLVKEAGVGRRTLFTYICDNCKEAFPSLYQDARANCRFCKQNTARMPDPGRGVSREVLAKVFNTFDVYVQYANSEGFGMPAVEAASCGVPVFEVDYSAMSDVVRKLQGTPIAVKAFARDSYTHCKRAVPDNDDFVAKLVRFLRQPDALRARAGRRARAAVLEHYTYDRTAKIWADHFRSVKLRDPRETWEAPPRPHSPCSSIPDELSNEEWVRFGIAHVAGRPDLADSYMALRMTRDLNWGMTGGGMGGLMYNDASCLGLEGVESQRFHFNREIAFKQLLDIAAHHNRWDSERCSSK